MPGRCSPTSTVSSSASAPARTCKRTSSSSGTATPTSSRVTPPRWTSCSKTLASQMAAMRELLGSMTPEQRAKLAELSEAVLEAHPGLSSELKRLASNLAGGALAEGASSAGNPTGVVLPPGLIGASGLPGPFGTEATSFVGQVTDLGQLEAAPLRGAQSRSARRGGHRTCARAARRRGRTVARDPRPPRPRATPGRPRGTEGGPLAPDPAGPAPDRRASAQRALHQACPLQGRPARSRAAGAGA